MKNMSEKPPTDPAAPAEADASTETEESAEESAEPTPTVEDLQAKIAELEKQLKPAAKKDEKKPDEKDPDPIIVDYAENLKTQLGKAYDKDLDKLPLKERINVMKFLVKAQQKPPGITEGKTPKPKPDNAGTPIKVSGLNFKELGKKY